MSIFKVYFDYLEYKAKELEDFIKYFLDNEYTDLDCNNIYEPSEYTMEVGDDDLPF